MDANTAIGALLFSLAAGLSTLLGAAVVMLVKGNSKRLVTISLGFAVGVMISVSFLDMLPESIRALSEAAGDRLGVALAVLTLLCGVLMGAGIDRLVPHERDDKNEKSHGNMYRLGTMSMLAIAVHNFPEGIATFAAGVQDVRLGASIALAIAMHNIPEGISVAMPIYFACGSKKRAFAYTFISGISEPAGALIAYVFLLPFINDLVLGILFGIVAGIMLYISIEELIPSSRQYNMTRAALVSTFAGICLMPLTHLIG